MIRDINILVLNYIIQPTGNFDPLVREVISSVINNKDFVSKRLTRNHNAIRWLYKYYPDLIVWANLPCLKSDHRVFELLEKNQDKIKFSNLYICQYNDSSELLYRIYTKYPERVLNSLEGASNIYVPMFLTNPSASKIILELIKLNNPIVRDIANISANPSSLILGYIETELEKGTIEISNVRNLIKNKNPRGLDIYIKYSSNKTDPFDSSDLGFLARSVSDKAPGIIREILAKLTIREVYIKRILESSYTWTNNNPHMIILIDELAKEIAEEYNEIKYVMCNQNSLALELYEKRHGNIFNTMSDFLVTRLEGLNLLREPIVKNPVILPRLKKMGAHINSEILGLNSNILENPAIFVFPDIFRLSSRVYSILGI